MRTSRTRKSLHRTPISFSSLSSKRRDGVWSEQEKKLEAYKNAHAGQLPSQQPANLQSIQNAQLQLQIHQRIHESRAGTAHSHRAAARRCGDAADRCTARRWGGHTARTCRVDDGTATGGGAGKAQSLQAAVHAGSSGHQGARTHDRRLAEEARRGGEASRPTRRRSRAFRPQKPRGSDKSASSGPSSKRSTCRFPPTNGGDPG